MSALFHAGLRRWVELITARARIVLLVALAAAAAALAYTGLNLTINTSTTEMISEEVPFRRNAIAFNQAFPAFSDPIVAVIAGRTPEQVDAAAAALAEMLRRDVVNFEAVDDPASDPFFSRNGLLYLDLVELEETADRLAAAQPLLAALAEDPTMRGLAAFLALALEEGGEGALEGELDTLLGSMAGVIDAQLAEEPRLFSWRRAMRPESGDPIVRRLVIAQPELDYGSLAPAAKAIEALRTHAAMLGIDPAHGLQLSLTGEAVLDQEELESVGAGSAIAAILTTVAVAILLVWGLGSFRLIAATLLTLLLGLIFTAGFAALAIGRLNLLSVTFAVLFVGLGVDFGIHLVLRYREALAREGSQSDAIRSAVLGVGDALSLTALCAAFGFLAFVPTDYRGLAELGIISAGGMAIAWLTSLTLLPALLCLMPLSPERLRPAQRPPAFLPTVQRRARIILALALAGAVASLVALPRLEFDFNPLNLKDPASESVATFHALAADPGLSPYVIDVIADNPDAARVIAGRLRELDVVGETITLLSFVPQEQDEKLEIIESLAFYLGPVLEPASEAVPLGLNERREALNALQAALRAAEEEGLINQETPGAGALAGVLERFENAFDHDPGALVELETRLTGTLPDLLARLRTALEAEPVGLDDLPADIRTRWLSSDGQTRVLVRPRDDIDDNRELEAFADAVLAAVPTATGTPVVVTQAADAVIGAFGEASWLALALITALLAFVLRSVRDIILVLAPLGLAILLTAGTAVVLGLSLNFANVIVLPLLLGLGVSGAIHVVVRERQSGEREDFAATSTPRAIVFSALTTIASFGSLAISDHRGLASMGLLLTIAILWSLVCTLVFLPSLLAVLRSHRTAADRTVAGQA